MRAPFTRARLTRAVALLVGPSPAERVQGFDARVDDGEALDLTCELVRPVTELALIEHRADGVGQRTGYGSFPARLPEHPLLPRSGRTERP